MSAKTAVAHGRRPSLTKPNLSFWHPFALCNDRLCHDAEILVGHGIRLVLYQLEMGESRIDDFTSTNAVSRWNVAVIAGLPRLASAGPRCPSAIQIFASFSFDRAVG